MSTGTPREPGSDRDDRDDGDERQEPAPSIPRPAGTGEEERKRQEQGNRGPDEVEGFGQGA
jgi:hypothetical protein